jgi:hypothetical protein
MIIPDRIKLNEHVWHDEPYYHPQLRIQVPKDFYDRTDEKVVAERILRSLESRRTVILVGERRAGKTSFLRLMADHLKNDPSGQFLPIILPWRGIHSRAELFREMVQGLHFELELKMPPLDRPSDISSQDDITTAELVAEVRGLLGSAQGRIAVFCIDEFDSILEEKQTAQEEKGKILDLVNGIAETSDLPITVLLTMAHDPAKLESTRSSRLAAISKQIYLRPFKKDDFDEMLIGLTVSNMQLSHKDLDQLFDLSGGWPYFAKLVLTSFSNQAGGRIALARALEESLDHPAAQQALENIYYMHFNRAEKVLMLLLAKHNGYVTREGITAAGSRLELGDRLNGAAHELADRGYVTVDSDGGCSFRIGYLKEWFPSWERFVGEVKTYLQETL